MKFEPETPKQKYLKANKIPTETYIDAEVCRDCHGLYLYPLKVNVAGKPTPDIEIVFQCQDCHCMWSVFYKYDNGNTEVWEKIHYCENNEQ